MALHQIGADLVEPLREADFILFVDATMDNLENGRTWSKIQPEPQILPYLTHHIDPPYLLGLIQAFYRRSVPAWLVSIQGDDFNFGEKLSPGAEKKAEKVSREILQFIDKKGGVNKISIEKDIHTGVNHEKRSRHPDN